MPPAEKDNATVTPPTTESTETSKPKKIKRRDVWKKVSVGLVSAALAGWFSVSLAGAAVSGGAAPVGVGALLGTVVGGYAGYSYREKIGNTLGLQKGPLRTLAAVAVGALAGAAVGAAVGGIGVAIAGVMSSAVAFLAAGAVIGGLAGAVFGCIRTKRDTSLGPVYGLVTGAVAGAMVGMVAGVAGVAGGIGAFTGATAVLTAAASALFVGPWIYKNCDDLYNERNAKGVTTTKSDGGTNTGKKEKEKNGSKTPSQNQVQGSDAKNAEKPRTGSLFSQREEYKNKNQDPKYQKSLIIGNKLLRNDSIGEATFEGGERGGGRMGRGYSYKDRDFEEVCLGPVLDEE